MAPLLDVPDNFEERLQHALRLYQDSADKKLWHIGLDRLGLTIDEFHAEPNPSVTFRFTVIQETCNGYMTLHGGCAQTLMFDFTTVLLVVLSRPGLYSRYGASQNFTTRFFRQLGLGEKARLVCELDFVGKRRVMLRAKLYRENGGELCVMAEHEKVNTDEATKPKM